jgi:hypothetical protein
MKANANINARISDTQDKQALVAAAAAVSGHPSLMTKKGICLLTPIYVQMDRGNPSGLMRTRAYQGDLYITLTFLGQPFSFIK